jgi:hypothetical protein
MVMGALTVNCGPSASLLATNTPTDSDACQNNPTSHTQTIYLEWYTPHAFTLQADGHGTYSEVVEEQPGSGDFLLGIGDYLSVYVDTSQLHASSSPVVDTTPVSDDTTFGQLVAHLSSVHGFNQVPLDRDMTVSVSF